MASYSVVFGPSAEDELRAVPFPFRRQIVHAIYRLKENPRPERSETIDAQIRRLPVHGWRLVYEVDDEERRVTIYRVTR